MHFHQDFLWCCLLQNRTTDPGNHTLRFTIVYASMNVVSQLSGTCRQDPVATGTIVPTGVIGRAVKIPTAATGTPNPPSASSSVASAVGADQSNAPSSAVARLELAKLHYAALPVEARLARVNGSSPHQQKGVDWMQYPTQKRRLRQPAPDEQARLLQNLAESDALPAKMPLSEGARWAAGSSGDQLDSLLAAAAALKTPYETPTPRELVWTPAGEPSPRAKPRARSLEPVVPAALRLDKGRSRNPAYWEKDHMERTLVQPWGGPLSDL